MYVKVVCSHQKKKIQPARKTDTISFKIKKRGGGIILNMDNSKK